MLSDCMKCRKNTDSKNQNVIKTKKGGLILYQTVQCGIVKNRKFIKSKKLEEYLLNWQE